LAGRENVEEIVKEMVGRREAYATFLPQQRRRVEEKSLSRGHANMGKTILARELSSKTYAAFVDELKVGHE
jgi:hypothetical protein